MANVTGFVTVSATATTTQASSTVNCKEIKLIKNDGAVDLTIGIDNIITDGNTITLKAGESLENFPVYVDKLYYKTAADATAFRFIGLREKNF